jgi:NADH-quinone oxidoreductase subunit J
MLAAGLVLLLPAGAAAQAAPTGRSGPVIRVEVERPAGAGADGVPLVERYREGGGSGWMSSRSHVVFFWFGAAAALVGAIAVIVARRPMRAALGLLLVVLATAGLYLLLKAELLAALQVLIYAGAVVVLLVFVITFLDQGATSPPGGRRLPIRVVAVAAVVYVFYLASRELLGVGLGTRLPVGPEFGTTTAVARELFGAFLIPFEAASALLLAAIVGAVAVARGRTDPSATPPAAAERPAAGGPGAGGEGGV